MACANCSATEGNSDESSESPKTQGRRAFRAPPSFFSPGYVVREPEAAGNAGEEGAVVVGKIHESKDPNYGYNAATNEYEDLVKAGVIDPTKVTRTALLNAASIAGLMLTTEAMVSEIPEPKQAAPAGHGGGMGDMY